MPVDTLSMTMPVATATAQAPGKINLTLSVLGRRSDGFHEIDSLVIAVGMHDAVTVRSGSLGARRPSIACNDSSLAKPANLAAKAAKLLANRLGLVPDVHIELEKRIPVGGGMGGGSSDAAAVLRLCNVLWGAPLTDVELASLGERLGSDVALFFSLPACRIRGRGERVEPVRLAWSGWALLASAGVPVSTSRVYAAWGEGGISSPDNGRIPQLCSADRAEDLMRLCVNDLEPAVFDVAPRVRQVFEALDGAGLGPFRVTGAGSTLFRLFDGENEAKDAAGHVAALGLGVRTAVVAAPAGPGRVSVSEDT
jgi:4-diphosphocytidyl-2C-methyl-D-erythritol kinase